MGCGPSRSVWRATERGRSVRGVGAVVSAGRGAGPQLWQCVAEEWPLGLERRDGESLSSVVQLDGLFGFLVAALEVDLMFALCPASNCWSSGGSPVAPVALELGDSPQLSPAQ